MYSLLVPQNPKECKIRAKGIKKSYVKKKVRHDQFLNVLKTLKPTPSTFRSFQSVNHVLRTVEINKTCLNAFDDKRYILNDGVGTLAYGHFRIPGVATAPWTLLCGDVYYTWIESLCMYCALLYGSNMSRRFEVYFILLLYTHTQTREYTKSNSAITRLVRLSNNWLSQKNWLSKTGERFIIRI